MTKQVQQEITPTHFLGTTGTVDGSTLGWSTPQNAKGLLGLGTSLNVTANNGNGTASLPAYTFVGDLDTGMWRPGANTLAFSTDGTQKITVLANGDVGIGVTSPVAKLQVNGNYRSSGSEKTMEFRNFKTATSVSTSATVIVDVLSGIGNFLIVSGADGDNRFTDLIVCGAVAGGGTINVFSSNTTDGTPAARTYTAPTFNTIALEMASGTYAIRVTNIRNA